MRSFTVVVVNAYVLYDNDSCVSQQLQLYPEQTLGFGSLRLINLKP